MNNLIQIGRKSGKSVSFLTRLLSGPLVDKFFFFAAISSFFASSYLGTHMWLMVQGETPAWANYYALRELHAMTQIYVFFGLFISGFLFQAAPKVFEVPGEAVSRKVLVLPIMVILGVTLSFDWFFPLAGRIIICASFLIAMLALLPIIKKASAARIVSIGIPILLSFAAFSVGAFLPLSRSLAASMIVWIGVIGAILGTSQQFAAGFLGGSKMKLKHGTPFLLCFLFSCISFISAFVIANDGTGSLWALTGALCGLTIVLYSIGTKTWMVFLNPFQSVLSFAVATGLIWALIGCFQLSKGGIWIDLALHSWALGWGIPLIIVVSLQIIGYLSGQKLLREKHKLILLALWLPIPIFRSLFHTAPPFTAWILGLLTTVVLVVWVLSLLKGIFFIAQRQLQTKADEEIVQC